ncbi:MAG: sensor histidine kinase, partial [Lachnospiraceae bacterium]
VTLNVLMERYQTEDGKDLLSLVGNWADYMTLAAQVEQAVEDLDYNYNEYLNFKERYSSASTTNIVYTFEMTMMGEKVRVSNLEVFDKVDLDEFYSSNYGRYMIYRPQTMTFESNTGIIEESDLFEAFSNYEYAYPDTAKIWLAVDTTYPANDQFAQAAAAYSFLHPYAYLVLGIAIVCVIVWVVMFLFLSVMTGYRRKKEETEAILILNWFDSIPTEIALALGGGVAVGVLFLLEELLYNQSGVWIDYICDNRMKATLFLSILGMFGSGLFCLFWYSLLRRIKAHTLWKSSLLHIIWQSIFGRIFNAIKKPVLKMYDNSSILFRCVLSLGIVMFVDFLLGALCYKYWRYLLYHSPGRLLLLMLFILLVNLGIIYLWFLSHMKRKAIVEGIARIRDGEVNYQVETKGMHGENLQLAEAVNSIGEGIKNAVETSMKDERLKADLITNVSHDIKTPLTSIINYVDLLKREKIETEPVKGYIEVLDAKSQRLKQLTDDLVEASKISSGNITLIMEKINLTELLSQSLGEFSEKFEEKNLQVVESLTGEAVYIEADSRRIWRVVENLFGNIYKYALPGTRVYLDMVLLEGEDKVALSIKNISAQPLNIEADELTERFIRGDVSRSTEGSGLGLSIARNLTELQNGKFDIYLDGDLFKVTLTFPLYAEREN